MNPTYDMPDNYYFGGGAQESFLTPLAAVILLVAAALIYCLPRKSMIVPFLAAGVLLPSTINLVVLGLHFPALRLLLAIGWLRFVVRRDIRMPRMNQIDIAVLFWALCNAICFCILWATGGAVANRLGFLWTTLGTYFLVRFVIRDKADVVRVIRLLAILMVIIAPFMLIEHFTKHNAFSLVGSPALSEIRDGRIRAQGPFAHSIIAGTIGAVSLPLFVGLWWEGRRYRRVVVLGVLASVGMVITSACSTPLVTCAGGVLALFFWPFRTRLRILRWGLALSLVGVHLAMKAPVWFLISRMGGSIGGSGYHRAMLIDNFFRHFGEWWLVGTRNNARWGFDMWDVDNAFVAAGLRGGLITFMAFIATLVYAYKRIGQSRRRSRKSRTDERFIWAIGASLFANTIGFFGIVYFDQSVLVWYSLLAMVSATPSFLADLKRTPSHHENANTTDETVSQLPLAVSSYGAGHVVQATE